MQIPALHSQLNSPAVSAEDLARNRNVTEKDKIHELCRQFEAVLLRLAHH